MKKHSMLISKILKSCHKVGGAVLRDFSELGSLKIESKGFYDFVSNADKKAESMLGYELQEMRPGYHFLMEESGYLHTSSIEAVIEDRHVYRWVIDPIDGTTNFIRGRPSFVICISLEKVAIPDGLVEIDDVRDYIEQRNVPAEVVAAVIHLPFYKESYWAELGMGAYHIDAYGKQTRLKVAPKQELGGAVVSTLLHNTRVESYDQIFRVLSEEQARWRISGSIAFDLMYLADGRADIVIFAEKLQRWDVSAAFLIAREAGAAIFTLGFKEVENVAQMNDGVIVSHHSLIDKIAVGLRKLN